MASWEIDRSCCEKAGRSDECGISMALLASYIVTLIDPTFASSPIGEEKFELARFESSVEVGWMNKIR